MATCYEWCDGKPEPIANDVAATRAAWEPNVEIWCSAMEQDLAPMLEPSVYRGNLGWCNSQKVWSTFWRELALQPKDKWLQAFGPYMPWAGAAGSMAYFETMPKVFWPLMHYRFENLDLIVHPAVVVWYEQQCTEFDGRVRAGQRAFWYNIEWMGNHHRSLGEGRSGKSFALAEYLDLTACAIDVYGFKKEQQARILGHLLMGPMPEATKPGMVEAIQLRMGHLLENDLNVPLVALCSGYTFHGVLAEDAVVRGINSIARQFMVAQQKREHLDNTMLADEGYTAMMLASMPAFNNWEGLYHGVQALGLCSARECIELEPPLDGGMFDTGETNLSPS